MQFRVLTYNIHFGGRGRETEILQTIRHLSPDVMLLVEASNEKVVESIALELGLDYRISNQGKAKLAFLSKIPILSWNSYCPPHTSRALLEIKVQPPSGNPITLFGVHLECHYFAWNEK